MNRCAIVFDIGETLVAGPAQGPATRLAKILSLDPQARDTLRQALMSRQLTSAAQVAEYICCAFGTQPARTASAVTYVWRSQLQEGTLKKGALRTVEAFAHAGFTIGILSNIWHPYRERMRDLLAPIVRDHCRPEHQFYSYERGLSKPSPALFSGLCDALDVAQDRVVMVGDSYLEDIAPATAQGMKAVWVTSHPPLGLCATCGGSPTGGSFAQVSNLGELTVHRVVELLGAVL